MTVREYSDSFFAAVGSEYEILLVRNMNACDPNEIWNRMEILVRATIDQIYRVVCRVSDIENPGLVVDGGVVEAALLLVCWEFYVAEMSEKIRDLPCRLRDIVLEVLSSFGFELAELVERVVCWKL